MKKKMTMKGYENSLMDAAAHKAGKHGKEGSKRDKAADKADLKKINKKK